ncbi:MAG: peptide deformylase [Halanaerobiales bacterium]|nr:peptide deformylase [Halanaerobiales bacterium]
MAVLPIRKIGDPVLRSKSNEVKNINEKTKQLIENMIDSMEAADGIGLAAPQIGILQRVIVVKVEDDLRILINPSVIVKEGEALAEEGCLSVPGRTGIVKRAEKATIEGLNENSEEVKYKLEGLKARAFLHEIDHLDGTLFVDKAIEIKEDNVE